MFEKLSKNLDRLMKDTNTGSSQLARDVGIPATTIKRIRNHVRSNPTLISLLPLCRFFNVSVSQLIGEEDLPSTQSEILTNKAATLKKIPLLDWKDALPWKTGKIVKPPKQIHITSPMSNKAYALKVEEDCWENFVLGTLLLVDPKLEPKHGDHIIVCRKADKGQNETTLKRLMLNEGKKYLRSVIAGCETTQFTNKHVLLGVVVEYQKKLIS